MKVIVAIKFRFKTEFGDSNHLMCIPIKAGNKIDNRVKTFCNFPGVKLISWHFTDATITD